MEQSASNILLGFLLKSVCFLKNAFKEETPLHSDVVALRFICPRERVNISKYDYTHIYIFLKKKPEMFCTAIFFLSNCPPFEMLIHIEGLLSNATFLRNNTLYAKRSDMNRNTNAQTITFANFVCVTSTWKHCFKDGTSAETSKSLYTKIKT